MRNWHLALQADGSVTDAISRNGAARFAWHHLNGRDEEALRWLEGQEDIPPHVFRALTAVETRPRTEVFNGGALINLRGLGATPDDDPDELVSIRIWASAGEVVSVSFRTMQGLEDVREEMVNGQLLDPGDLISSIALHITALLDPRVAELGDIIDDCEVTLDPDLAFAMRRTIGKARSQAIGYRRFIVPQRQGLERLSAIECHWLNDDDRQHLREAADRFARMAEELEAIRERSALLHEQLTDLRAELIETRTLVLSIVALVFLPLTFLTGLLGMNVDGIPYAHKPWAFAAVVAVCVMIAAGIAGYFIKARWSRQ
jgi:zinc transporter